MFPLVFLVIAEVAIDSENSLTARLLSIFQVGVYVSLGWFANDIRRWFLRAKGFQKQSSVSACWPSKAISQHIDSMLVIDTVEELNDDIGVPVN